MKFGHVEKSDLDQIDFTLPQDHSRNIEVLKSASKDKKVNVYCGCAKWGIKEWQGILYPEKTKEKDYLAEYVKHFNTIELNTTFYSLKKDNVKSWKEKAPEGFKFCPKFNRRVSHIKRLKLDDDYLDYFLDTTISLENNLGMPFLQLPENFSSKYQDRLEEFIEALPDDYPTALELRHESWFGASPDAEVAFDILEKNNKCAVITDVAGRRDVLHMRLTSPEVFIRFNGYGFDAITKRRLDSWVYRLKEWIDMGLNTIYFFPHQKDETNTPITCHYFITKLNEVCGLNIQVPDITSAES